VARKQTKSQSEGQGLGDFSSPNSQAIDPQSMDTEIALVMELKAGSLRKNISLLFEALALSKFVLITGSNYQFLMRSEDVSNILVNKEDETPYLIITFRNGKEQEISLGEIEHGGEDVDVDEEGGE